MAKCVTLFLLFFTVLGHIIQSISAFMEDNVGIKAILRFFKKDFVALIWENYPIHLTYTSSLFIIPFTTRIIETLGSNMIPFLTYFSKTPRNPKWPCARISFQFRKTIIHYGSISFWDLKLLDCRPRVFCQKSQHF